MRITKLSIHRVSLAAWGGETRYSQGRARDIEIETNVLRLETDDGLIGWGESCTAPSYYYPTLSSGTRAAIEHVAPLLLGEDPTNVNQRMIEIGGFMRGQRPAKAAIDMALWDLAGQAAGVPLCDLWGGRVAPDLPVLAMVSPGSTDAMLEQLDAYRTEGYRIFQLKIGLGEPADDVTRITRIMAAMQHGERCWFDVNRGWTVDQAMQVVPAVAHLGPLIEQPCETYEECRIVAQRTGLGLMLDESIDGADAFLRAHRDGVIDVAVLKFNATGGVGEHRFLARLGVELGVPMRIEDFFGTGITLAAVTHIAHTFPRWATFGLYDYHMPAVPVVRNPLPVIDGVVSVPDDAPAGLGVDVDPSVIGPPVFEAGIQLCS